MITYKPRQAPRDPNALPQFIDQELHSIQQAANREDGYLAVLPSKPQDRIYLFAAGVAGTSRGAYRYDSATPGWVFLA